MKAAFFRGHRQSQLTRAEVDSRMERPKKGHLEVRKDPRKSRWGEAWPRTACTWAVTLGPVWSTFFRFLQVGGVTWFGLTLQAGTDVAQAYLTEPPKSDRSRDLFSAREGLCFSEWVAK